MNPNSTALEQKTNIKKLSPTKVAAALSIGTLLIGAKYISDMIPASPVMKRSQKSHLKQQEFSSFPSTSLPYISKNDTEHMFNITCVEKTSQTKISPLSSENLPELIKKETWVVLLNGNPPTVFNQTVKLTTLQYDSYIFDNKTTYPSLIHKDQSSLNPNKIYKLLPGTILMLNPLTDSSDQAKTQKYTSLKTDKQEKETPPLVRTPETRLLICK